MSLPIEIVRMCWNAEASLTTWAAGSLVCVMLLLRRNGVDPAADRVYGFFYLWVLTMQLLEFVMWQDPGCTGANQIASQIAWFQNLTQPLVLIVLALAVLPTSQQRIPRGVLVGACTIYGLCIVYWVCRTGILHEDLCARASSGCVSLKWPWLRQGGSWVWGLYFAMLFLALLNVVGGSMNWLVGFTMASLVFAGALAGSNVGSWWCLVAVACPLVWFVALGAAPCARIEL